MPLDQESDVMQSQFEAFQYMVTYFSKSPFKMSAYHVGLYNPPNIIDYELGLIKWVISLSPSHTHSITLIINGNV